MEIDHFDRSTLPGSRTKGFFVRAMLIVTILVIVTSFSIQRIKSLDTPDPLFPAGEDIVIPEGMSISEITELLQRQYVVRSALYLYFVLHQEFNEAPVKAGTYRFDEPRTTTSVARSITRGEDLTPSLKITFPEGFRSYDILAYLPLKYKNEDITAVTKYEGYLFPDTYFISSSDTLPEIIERLHETFLARMDDLAPEIEKSGLNRDEVVTLASIIEREANSEESMRMVAGILINRLKIDMPLQVDAAFEYILHKTSVELTDEDLALDSPYNTYINHGLPPTPISNPGMTAIRAVLNPSVTDALYYLTDSDGNFHYAKTFEEHKQNKARYLR